MPSSDRGRPAPPTTTCATWPTCRIDVDGRCLTRGGGGQRRPLQPLTCEVRVAESMRESCRFDGPYTAREPGIRPPLLPDFTLIYTWPNKQRARRMFESHAWWSLILEARRRSRGRPERARGRAGGAYGKAVAAAQAHGRRYSMGCFSIFQVNTRGRLDPPSMWLLDQLRLLCC